MVRRSYFSTLATRLAKIPYSHPSAGSVFKRPASGVPIGMAIERLGLKGFRVNDAQVSDKHGGVIINIGGACGRDIVNLVELMSRRLRVELGVVAELEQIII